MTVGVMGGSFDPVHIGHLMVASYLAQTAGLDSVWLSLSPANPLKAGSHPASDAHRMAMLRMAVDGSSLLRAIDTELTLPRPSYTLQLLETLHREHPGIKFKLIIGSDNWLVFDRWRAHDEIISRYGVIIYPRPGYDIAPPVHPNVTLVDAPTVSLSSTLVRDCISRGLDMSCFLPHGVYEYIKTNNLYE